MIGASVRFALEGGFPERFLNEAAARGVSLWDIRQQGIVLTARCKAAQYHRLRPAARAASVRMRVSSRHGLPFVLRPFRKRAGLAVGAVCFIGLLLVLSSRIWTIRVEGNERVGEQAIREVLEPLGVYEGASFAAVDLAQVQLTALEQLPELMWLTVNVQGSTAVIEVKERQPSQPIAADGPSNIVATCDGIVTKIDAVTGQAAVKVGDAVTEGTLLISGVMDSKVGPLLKRAEGVVTARTTRTLTVTVPYDEVIPSRNPDTILRPSLYVLGFRLPLYTSARVEGDFTVQVTDHPLRAYGKALPVGVEVVRLVAAQTEIRHRSPQGAKAEAEARLAAQIAAWDKTVHVENSSVTVTETDDGITLTAIYDCTEPIGRSVPLETTEK